MPCLREIRFLASRGPDPPKAEIFGSWEGLFFKTPFVKVSVGQGFHCNRRPKFGSFWDRDTRVTVEVELLVLFLEKINKSGTKMVFCDLVN